MRRGGFTSWVSFSLLVLIVGCPGGWIPLIFRSAGLLWLGWRLYRQRASGRDVRQWTRFFSGSAVILSLLLVYYLNPSHRWTEGIGALPVSHLRFLPATAFRPGTLGALWFTVTVLVAVGLAMDLGRGQRMWLMAGVVAVSAATALVVLGQRFSPRPFPVFDLTGFFPYENHYAAFANLILPVALCAGARRTIRAYETGRVSSPAGLFYFSAGLMVAAVALSRSRAGLLISCLMLTAFIGLQIRLRRRYPLIGLPFPRRIRTVYVAGIASGGLAAVLYFFSRLRRVGEELSFRAQVLADTLSVWSDKPFWGSGPGSFSSVFPYYQSLPVEKYFFLHAHCDPLQFLAEYGLLGGAVVLGAAGWILFRRPGPARVEDAAPTFLELEGAGLWLALAGVGLHSLVDFPLHHPLIALLSVVWIGILTGLFTNGFAEH
jgi:hypothetical protein